MDLRHASADPPAGSGKVPHLWHGPRARRVRRRRGRGRERRATHDESRSRRARQHPDGAGGARRRLERSADGREGRLRREPRAKDRRVGSRPHRPPLRRLHRHRSERRRPSRLHLQPGAAHRAGGAPAGQTCGAFRAEQLRLRTPRVVGRHGRGGAGEASTARSHADADRRARKARQGVRPSHDLRPNRRHRCQEAGLRGHVRRDGHPDLRDRRSVEAVGAPRRVRVGHVVDPVRTARRVHDGSVSRRNVPRPRRVHRADTQSADAHREAARERRQPRRPPEARDVRARGRSGRRHRGAER